MTNNIDSIITKVEKQALKDHQTSLKAVKAIEAEIEAIQNGEAFEAGPTPEAIEAKWGRGEDVPMSAYVEAVFEHKGHLMTFPNAAGGKTRIANSKARVLAEGADRRLKMAQRKIVHIDSTLAELVAEAFGYMFPGMPVRAVSGPLSAVDGIEEGDMPLVLVGPSSAVSSDLGYSGRVTAQVYRPVYLSYDGEDVEAAIREGFHAQMVTVAASNTRSTTTASDGTQITVRHKDKGKWGNGNAQVGGFVVDVVDIAVAGLTRKPNE